MLINVDLSNLLITLIIGLAAGFVANFLFGKRNFSLLTSLFLGLGGAFVGGIILPALGIRAWGLIGNFITATVGALLLLFVVSLFSKRSGV
jgi:uncharacterized membrane protein YeaQ/YmgE (transglycosylase-associated protein family)